jgi:hypothetical protein
MTETTHRDQLTVFIELVCHLAWPLAWENTLMHRFGEQYSHDMIRRVTEIEFEIVLAVIKLRDLLSKNSTKYQHNQLNRVRVVQESPAQSDERQSITNSKTIGLPSAMGRWFIQLHYNQSFAVRTLDRHPSLPPVR